MVAWHAASISFDSDPARAVHVTVTVVVVGWLLEGFQSTLPRSGSERSPIPENGQNTSQLALGASALVCWI